MLKNSNEKRSNERSEGGACVGGQPEQLPSATPQPFTSAPHAYAKQTPEAGQIDINTATEKELTTVPGIGDVTAARIIAARPFRSADDLKRVSGIGDKNTRGCAYIFSEAN
jgi:DNA uptake protein ComE-like DNA-binding protein